MKWTSLLLLVLAGTTVPAACHSAEGIPPAIAEAAEQLAAEEAAGGLIVYVGCEDGKQAAALGSGGRFLVHCLVGNRETLSEVRNQLVDEGVHGQVTAELWTGGSLPFVDDMVNFLVVGEETRLSTDEAMRVLVPDGKACIRSDGAWKELVKPRPEAIDEWSHWLHGPDNNAVSSDRRVGISRSLQWYMPPRWSRHHNLPAGFNALVSGGGRIFYLVDRAPNAVYGPGQWVLVARDAFNGLELWRTDVTDWHMEAWGAEERYGGRVGRFHGAPDYQAPRRIVVDGDRVFVTLGFSAPVSVVDGATGRRLKVYPDTRGAGEIIFRNGILYVARNTYEGEPGKEILAVDTRTGKTLWKNGDYKGIAASTGYQKQHTNAFITAGEDHLFLVDENDVVALDLHEGREAWKHRMPLTDEIVGDIDYRYSNFCTLVYQDGAVFFSQIHPGTKNMNKWEMKKLEIEALDAATGKPLWNHTGGTLAHVTPPDLFVNDGKVWTLDPKLQANGDCDARLVGLDCRTGEVAANHLLKNITHGHHHRCYRNKATEKLYLMGEEGIEYIDFETGETDIHYWLRGACRYGVMPANGFVYVPPHNCGCYLGTLVYGFVALKSRPTWSPQKAIADGFSQGPAYQQPLDSEAVADESDWPMFRGDPMRSCSAPVELPERLSPRWEASLGGELTAPAIVGDRVFLGSKDGCEVYCLDALDGTVRWRRAVDGPVDTPPTWSAGRLVFGTRAGTLYTLRAEDGAVIWRFRAGPARARIAAFGRLESPWPLGGSPLVLNGNVYCVAGRSMSLDSGLFVYKLDLQSGELLQEVNLQTDTEPKGETDDNFLADLLVSDGESVFMKSIRFDKNDLSQYRFEGRPNRRGAARQPKEILRCQTDMLDDSWLNCCFWAYKGHQAQQLAFDKTAAFGINGPGRVTWGGSYAHDVYRPGSGYRLCKWSFAEAEDGENKKPKGKKKGGGGEWENVRAGVRGRSMLLTGDRLFLAGTPDSALAGDFWAAYQNRQGASMIAVLRDGGAVIAEYELDCEPVYNGLAAAGQCLYMVMRNGKVACWGE